MPINPEMGLPLKSYLLGDLNPEAQQQLEQQLMTDAAAFDELERVESELIDAYIAGDLSSDETEKIETLFLLASERQEKLHFGRAFRRYIEEKKKRESGRALWRESWLAFWRLQNPASRWSVAAVLLLSMIAGGTWVMLRFAGLESALDSTAVEYRKQLRVIQTRNEELAASLRQEQIRRMNLEQLASNLGPRANLGPVPSGVYRVELLPMLFRDAGDEQRISIPPNASVVQFNVPAEKYPRYHAALQSEGAGEIATQTFSRPVSIRISSEQLVPGRYILELTGITENGTREKIGEFHFRVIPQK